VKYIPNQDGLLKMKKDNLSVDQPLIQYFYGSFLHPNPKLYKTYWSVYSFDSGSDPWAESLCTAEAMKRMSTLKTRRLEHMVGNRHVLRVNSGIPINNEHRRWVNYEFAPDFDKDEDPLWEGYR